MRRQLTRFGDWVAEVIWQVAVKHANRERARAAQQQK